MREGQGLKPIDSIDFIGTAKAVPCYKTTMDGPFMTDRSFRIAEIVGVVVNVYSDYGSRVSAVSR